MQQNTDKGRFNTEGHIPTWYRPSLTTSVKVGHPAPKRMFIGSGEDCIVTELNSLILAGEETCTL